ncbi:MAG: XdhC family protein [Alcaligenaceae bacterium]|nr:XdhC family protein [Alcaligenaceae bacterium]
MNTTAPDTALLSEALRLSEQDRPYAWATVVRAAPPTSAYVGAQAIVTAEGSLLGWVGGGCARDIVVQSCLGAIQDGNPRLIRISNDGQVSDPDTEHHAMPCASNGALELFIQPVRPAPALCIAGSTPAAMAAGAIAGVLGWRVSHGRPGVDGPPPDYVLVATQGADDAENLEWALSSPARKVLLIASRRKAEALADAMRRAGLGESRLSDLESPAGPDIQAGTPAEVALAAVAGLVRAHRRASGAAPSRDAHRDEPRAAEPAAARAAAAAYVNPVCLRPIDPASALHTVSIEGATHYFCCNGCKAKFDGDPMKYLEIARRMPGAGHGPEAA